MHGENENRRDSENGLSPQNQQWLDALFREQEDFDITGITKKYEKPEEPVPASNAHNQPKPEHISTEDEELEKILAEDWDNIILPEDKEIAAPEEAVIQANMDAPEQADAPATPQEKPYRRFRKRPEQKGRPKREDGYGLWGIPHILATVIWLALIVAIGVSLGRVLWVCCADVMAFGKDNQKVTITITEDDNINTISKKLGQANLVRYPNLFRFFAKITGKDDDIGVGTFTLNSQLDYNAMINAMYRYDSGRSVVDIMFPEGYNCAQIFKLLEENEVCTTAQLEEYAANGELSEYWFLEGIERGNKYCLEGYMAPDTYSFYKGDSPRRVIEKFLDEFDSRFTDKMKEDFQAMQATYASRLKANGFSVDYVQQHTLTIHQVVTLASIVQKEAASTDEGFKIAAVFYARLCDPKIMSLGADATVHYAVGDYFFDIKELTKEHLDFDSPYNTRFSQGIPPGPICNMGVQSLYAALEPDEEYYQYRYFVYDSKNKVHIFSKTEAEHEQNKKVLGYS